MEVRLNTLVLPVLNRCLKNSLYNPNNAKS
uniref:Uncharacterized protein n=1 Tax=Arundo donax TaxID=35708 RepID=A0A0A8ZU24_ARUDO